MNLSDPVTAALIGAAATFVTAVIQLTANARRQAAERAAGKPASRKSGSWLAIFALALAALVGGYALSEYQSYSLRGDDKLLREEMQTRLRDISAAAVRLERAGLEKNGQSEADARLAAERRRGAAGVAAIISVPPCRAPKAGLAQAPAACAEQEALRTTLCAVVPASATVTEVQVFTRLEDAQQSWDDARVQAGQDAGAARFVDAYFERAQGNESKEICQHFAHWNSHKGRSARILVKYTL
ncbi:MAG TPA: hypothetical protein VGR01_06505 [Burkholderiales bacterium]|jgi:hypothetical protein|nr:hypothetical protein [Burkholderiales bacterium]